MKILITAIVLFCLVGCGPTYGESYIVHIHPSFNLKTEEVLAAIEKWNNAVGISLTPIVEEPVHCDDPGNICIYMANESLLVEKTGPNPDGTWTGVTTRDTRDYATIYILDTILLDYPDPKIESDTLNALEETIPHELGHAFGLQHDPHMGTVMCANTGCGSTQISCWDKQQYYKLRGVDYYCP